MNTVTTTKRIASIDILRGIIMIIMALDHVRDFFSGFKAYDPLDLQHASTFMFFTRWITHFCAPVFVFLAGTSAFLSMRRGKTKKESSLFLLSRGVWLILLELTIVRFGWQFNLDYHMVFVQVIWAIGWSMIFLSLLIFLPMPAIAAIALVIIFGHNALDGIRPAAMGEAGPLWTVLHVHAPVPFGDHRTFMVLYPLVPWIGVMAAGYCFGNIMLLPEDRRNKLLYLVGFTCLALFFMLRAANVYGDPFPWEPQPTRGRTVLAFIKVNKYPPSLLYLLMTIGSAITVMPLLEKLNNGLGRFFTVYGRVPMFYYILHIYLIHGMALVAGVIMGFPSHIFTDNGAIFRPDNGWGFSLPVVYLYWLCTVLLLYYPCRWFMQLKARNKSWWLSYL
ncbi:DUF1624 domain-containing protein [Chitinophagaceae bacterium MMS25-I14]